MNRTVSNMQNACNCSNEGEKIEYMMVSMRYIVLECNSYIDDDDDAYFVFRFKLCDTINARFNHIDTRIIYRSQVSSNNLF